MIRKIKKEVGCSFKENIQYMDQTLPVEKSFDIIRREMEIGGKESVFYYIDGFIKDEQNGKSPLTVAKEIEKVINKKNPKALVSVGFEYKCAYLLTKILPKRLFLFIVDRVYNS